MEEHILHSSMTLLSNQKKKEMREMDGAANNTCSRISTEIVSKEANNQFFMDPMCSSDVNIPIKFAKDNINNTRKWAVTYEIPNGVSYPSIEHSLIQGEMGQIQCQSNEDCVTSTQFSDRSSQVQMESNQISIRSDQKSVVKRFEDQSTPGSGCADNTQWDRLSKETASSTAFKKKESQSSNLITKVVQLNQSELKLSRLEPKHTWNKFYTFLT